ncbi:MAG: hypothetical protein R6V56_02520 [Lentisphaeria bacterium]
MSALPEQLSLLNVTLPSVRSVTNHLTLSCHRFYTQPFSVAGISLTSDFRLHHFLADSSQCPAETCSLYYGPHIRLLLLPTPPCGDAVTVGYRPECVYLEGTRTPLAVYARRRTRADVSSAFLQRGIGAAG